MTLALAALLVPLGIIATTLLSAFAPVPDASAVLLTLVAFSGLLGGVWLGCWGALLFLAYLLWAASGTDGSPLPDFETGRFMTYLIAAPLAGVAAGLWRRTLENTRRLTTEREKFTNTIFEQAGVAIAYADVAGTILHCNKAYSDIVGHPRDEVVGMNFRDLVDPRDREENWLLSRQLLAGETDKFTLENRYIRKDGSSVWSRKVVTLIRTEAGKPSHLLAFVTDITDEMALRANLKTSEANYRSLWESAGNANFLVFAPGFGIEQANAAAVRFFGAPDQAALSGLRLSDLSPPKQDDGANSADKEHQLMTAALRDGRASFEWHFRSLDGKEAYATMALTRVEATGRVGLQCSAVDITDRVLLSRHQADARRLLAEEVNTRTAELEDVTYELHLAQSVGGMGSFSVDLVDNTFSCSPETARILNLEEFDRIPTGEWTSKIHPGDRQAVTDAWQRALAGATFDMTYRTVVPGGIRHVKAGARIKRDASGKAVSAIGALLDLTSLLANREKTVQRGYKARLDGLLAATAAVQADAEQGIDTDPGRLAEELLRQFPDWSAEELDAVIDQAVTTIKGHRQ